MADLALSDVQLRLGERDVLRGVTLAVPDRTVVALLGPAASGKSALVGAVAGLAQPHAGTIRIGDRTVFDGARRIDIAPHKRRVGLVSQSDAFWPQRTVFENVAFFAGLARRRDVKERAGQALELVGARDLADQLPPQLTANERRQVTLARALVREPAVMLLDDPLSHLDGPPRAEARTWLRQLLTGLHLPVLVATRDPVEAMALADRVVVINIGIVEQEGAAADVYSEPETVFATEYMAQSNRLLGTLVENAGTRALLEVMGSRLAGITQTRAPLGTKAVGLIRVERTRIGGGPGANRLPMTLATQMYVGERWEAVFVRDGLTVRAYTSAPLRHESYHVEFPPEALWVF